MLIEHPYDKSIVCPSIPLSLSLASVSKKEKMKLILPSHFSDRHSSSLLRLLITER